MRRGSVAILLLASCGASERLTPRRERAETPIPAVARSIREGPVVAPMSDPGPAPTTPAASPPLLDRPPAVWIVLTKPTAAGRARIRVKGRYTIATLDGSPLRTGDALDGDLVIDGSAATLDGVALPARGAELRPAAEADLRVESASYPGVLRIDESAPGRRRMVVVTDVETYVAAVVNSEVPAAYPREMQRTQAILARTYTMAAAAAAPDAPVLLSDTGGIDQEFSGIAVMPEHRRIAADAVSSTRGLVVMDGGEPLLSYYHSSCGGTTCPGTVVFGKLGAAPGLRGGVVCTGCSRDNKYYRWEARLPGAKVVAAAGLRGPLERFVVSERTAGDRAVSFDVTAGGRTRRVRAPDFRLQYGASALRSTLLEMAVVDAGDLVVRGRGWGHGVGLCQMGARAMAQDGAAAEAILAFYYPGATLERRW